MTADTDGRMHHMKTIAGSFAIIAALALVGCTDQKPTANTANTSAASASAGDGVTATAPTDGVKDAIKAGTSATDAAVPVPPGDDNEMANLKAAMDDPPAAKSTSKKH